MPPHFSVESKNILKKLLNKDPVKRLGGGSRGAAEIKAHPFFKSVNWDDLLTKKIAPPIVPVITDELDTTNFSEEFTALPAVDTPSLVPEIPESIFMGYSYAANSILFKEDMKINTISSPSPDKKPSISNILACMFDRTEFFQRYYMNLKERILGDGTFSVVRKCTHRWTGKDFAVKIISKKINCTREIELLKLAQMENYVVKFVETMEDMAHTYIVMELLEGGELLHRVRNVKRFTEPQAAIQMHKMVTAVASLHHKGIIHRDLKPENFVFSSDAEKADLKLVDFGFARLLNENNESLKSPCFTFGYAAPEVLESALTDTTDGYNEACDIWSLGVILYTMICGKTPFHREKQITPNKLISRIKQGNVIMSDSEWEYISESAKDLIRGMLTVESSKRLTIDQILSHNWILGRNLPSTSLMAPSRLVIEYFDNSRYTAVNQTINAFHVATRSGFRLMEVSKATIAQRRKNRKYSTDSRCTSSYSSASSDYSAASSSSGNFSMRTLPKSRSSDRQNVFTFDLGQIEGYKASQMESSSSSSKPSPICLPSTSQSSLLNLIRVRRLSSMIKKTPYTSSVLEAPIPPTLISSRPIVPSCRQVLTRSQKRKFDAELTMLPEGCVNLSHYQVNVTNDAKRRRRAL